MRKISSIVCGLAVFLGGAAWAQVTSRVTVGANGTEGNGPSFRVMISSDGRFMVFCSGASNLVAGDTNASYDVFVRDRLNNVTERTSVDSAGAQANGLSGPYAVSDDFRFVVFGSSATNLVAGDTNATDDIFVRDRQTGTTERVSVGSGGTQSDDESSYASISSDGRYIAFVSKATNLVPGDTNAFHDVFVHDRQSGTTERVSVDSAGAQADGESGTPVGETSITPDGRYVLFTSTATNLVPGDTNGRFDIFLRDRQTGSTERASLGSGGTQSNGDSFGPADFSSDARYVVFASSSTNLVAGGDTNNRFDVFLHDRQTGITERVSDAPGGTQGNDDSDAPVISPDGRFVAFRSIATNLVAGDTNGRDDVFLRDRQAGTTERVSLDSISGQGNNISLSPSLSPDGRFIAFESSATNLVPGDTNNSFDGFLRDRLGGPSFTSLCDPGTGGVQACPCSNPPSGAGRGCDNSAATGGAVLSAFGNTSLTSDSLVFRTSSQRPTGLSILLQGTSSPPAGILYGQGVRCVGGSLKRLFSKAPVGGSMTAPNSNAGDPTISFRSASKGDQIGVGQSRWYLVYYRDPTVLGGCPASSTFNATQTGRVAWSL